MSNLSNQNAIFTLMVDNEFGVLTRITALIRRAGWNIRSLSVAETELSEISRLTICIECKNNTLEYVREKLIRQSCVREISLFSPGRDVAQELAIVRVTSEAAAGLRADSEISIKCLDEAENVFSIMCEPGKMADLLAALSGNGLLAVARTGTVALGIKENQ